MRTLRLISYLSPSIPEGLFRLIAGALETELGVRVTVAFETRVSGPSPNADPFAEDRADIAFVCAPSYPLLKESGSPVTLLPAAPVFMDPRAQGQPVYFSDVVVASRHPARRFEELSGSIWSYNDRFSRSGWQSMLARLEEIGHQGGPETFFAGLVQSGSHLRSLGLVETGAADAAAIDSNTLWLARRRDPDLATRLRVIESWGPMPIQPVIAHSALGSAARQRVTRILLRLDADPIRRAALEEHGVLRFAPVEEASYASAAARNPVPVTALRR